MKLNAALRVFYTAALRRLFRSPTHGRRNFLIMARYGVMAHEVGPGRLLAAVLGWHNKFSRRRSVCNPCIGSAPCISSKVEVVYIPGM